MVGTVADAEDLVQETFVRWHEAQHENIQSPRAYLTTIITRLCINHLESAHVKREEYVGPWLPEPLITEERGAYDHSSLSYAFLLLLEKLSPVERAVFLLHEVFEYDYDEIGRITGKTETNCRQILSRARKHLTVPGSTLPDREEQSRLMYEFLKACQDGDVTGLVSLLSEQITLYSDGGGKVPSALNPIYGVDKVVRFLISVAAKTSKKDLSIRLCEINGMPGMVAYTSSTPFTSIILDLDGSKIRNIFIVNNPDKLKNV